MNNVTTNNTELSKDYLDRLNKELKEVANMSYTQRKKEARIKKKVDKFSQYLATNLHR